MWNNKLRDKFRVRISWNWQVLEFLVSRASPSQAWSTDWINYRQSAIVMKVLMITNCYTLYCSLRIIKGVAETCGIPATVTALKLHYSDADRLKNVFETTACIFFFQVNVLKWIKPRYTQIHAHYTEKKQEVIVAILFVLSPSNNRRQCHFAHLTITFCCWITVVRNN